MTPEQFNELSRKTRALMTEASELEKIEQQEQTKFAEISEKTGLSVVEIKKRCKKLAEIYDFSKVSSKEAIELVSVADEEQRRKLSESYRNSISTNHAIYNFFEGVDNSVNTEEISTGFPRLDKLLDGGLYEGLYFIGAISSLGKTTFMLQVADQIAKNEALKNGVSPKRDVIFFSLETKSSELASKSFSRITYTIAKNNPATYDCDKHPKTSRNLTNGKLWKNFSPKELALINEAMSEYGEYYKQIIFVDSSEYKRRLTIEDIKERVSKHVELTGTAPIVIIDYVQIIAPHDGFRGTDKQHIDNVVTRLKFEISNEFKIPVICISSLNRENYTIEINMAAFKESGAIEYSSDVLLGLQLDNKRALKMLESEANEFLKTVGKHENSRQVLDTDKINGFFDKIKSLDNRPVELKILKNRNGRGGVSLKLNYKPMFNYFEEAPEEESDRRHGVL